MDSIAFVKSPFKPGELLEGVIVVPGESFGFPEPLCRLRCHVMITRLERLPEGFGLGCHIEDYSVDGGAPSLSR